MATRSKRFIAGMVSGYGSIAANAVATMVSVPLALAYLDKERFGLWALAVQISGYLALVDLGMSGAVSRFLADHKDDVDGAEYGRHLSTGALVFLIQGFLVAAAGLAIAPFAAAMFSVPPHLAGEFRLLLIVLTVSTGFSVALRSIGAPLWAFQRNDVVYACATATHVVSLALLWIGFHLGWGVMSFAISQIPPMIGTIACYGWICHRNNYYPSKKHFGAPTLEVFRRMFHFGKDNLLIVLGGQLVNASQIMIISRWVGLEATATFSVATKFYGMAMQVVSNPVSASSPALTELWVRGEKERFTHRFWDLISLTLCVSTIAAAGLAAGNKAMISVWTHHEIQWSCLGDLMLGVMIVVRNLNFCFIGLFGFMGNLAPVRWILFLEGVAFVLLAVVMRGHAGINGIFAASIAAHLGITGVLSYRAARPIIGGISHLRVPLACAMTCTCLASGTAFLAYYFESNAWLVLCAAAACGLLTSLAMWKFALPQSLKLQVTDRLQSLLAHFKPANV